MPLQIDEQLGHHVDNMMSLLVDWSVNTEKNEVVLVVENIGIFPGILQTDAITADGLGNFVNARSSSNKLWLVGALFHVLNQF